MYNLQCVVYTVQLPVYSLQLGVQCTVTSVHCRAYSVQCTLHLGNCILFTVHCRDVTRLKSLQNSGAFWELFWVLLTKTKKFCGIFKKIGSFSGAFLGAFDKYVEILCYFGSFFKVLVSFGSFLGRFWPILKYHRIFCAIFCAISWKTPNSGELPNFGSR